MQSNWPTHMPPRLRFTAISQTLRMNTTKPAVIEAHRNSEDVRHRDAAFVEVGEFTF
jgi:hypothetical protein